MDTGAWDSVEGGQCLEGQGYCAPIPLLADRVLPSCSVPAPHTLSCSSSPTLRPVLWSPVLPAVSCPLSHTPADPPWLCLSLPLHGPPSRSVPLPFSVPLLPLPVARWSSLPCPSTSSVSPSPCLSLPPLSGKAAVIYELRTGPAAGAGGPISASQRKLPARDGRETAFTQSSPGGGRRAGLSARDGWRAGEGPLLHSHLCGQTIKHLHTALTRAAASPAHSQPGPGSGPLMGKSRAVGRRWGPWGGHGPKPQESPTPGSQPRF